MDLIGQQPPSVPSAAIARAIQVQVTGPATAGCVLAAASSSASTDRVDPDREDTDSTDGVQSCSSVNKPVSGGRSTAAAASREDSEQVGRISGLSLLLQLCANRQIHSSDVSLFLCAKQYLTLTISVYL